MRKYEMIRTGHVEHDTYVLKCRGLPDYLVGDTGNGGDTAYELCIKDYIRNEWSHVSWGNNLSEVLTEYERIINV